MFASPSIEQIDPIQFPGWDALLATHPGHSFFHGSAWARVLSHTYGYAPAYFIVEKAGALRALLPLMEVDSWLTGRRGIGLPFTDGCEPLHSGNATFGGLVQGAVKFARSRDWKFLECRGGRELFPDATPSLTFYEHQLELDADVDRLFSSFRDSVCRAIRKAEKSGVTVTVSSDLAAMRIFYKLQCLTRRKHGLPPQPFLFFRNIWEHVLRQNQGFIVTAKYEGRPIAASVYFHSGGRAIYKYGAADEDYQHMRSSNLVMWEAIKWCARCGFKTLHLGRTSITNEGLRYFKLGWGAAESRLDYVRYDLRINQYVRDSDETSGWHTAVFRRLPIPLSRLAGTVLYKHWA